MHIVGPHVVPWIDHDFRGVQGKAIHTAGRRNWVLAGHVVKGVNIEEDIADAGDGERIRAGVECKGCRLSLVCLAVEAVRAHIVPRVDRNRVDPGEQERVRPSHENAGGRGIAVGVDAEVVTLGARGDRVIVHTGYDDYTSRPRGRGKQVAPFYVVSACIVARIDRDLYIVEGKTTRTADRCGRVLARYVRDGVDIESDVPNTLQSDGVVVHTGYNDDFTSRTRRERE